MAKGLPRSLKDLYARVEALETAVGGGVTITAAQVTFDDSNVNISAENVQEAIAALDAAVAGGDGGV